MIIFLLLYVFSSIKLGFLSPAMKCVDSLSAHDSSRPPTPTPHSRKYKVWKYFFFVILSSYSLFIPLPYRKVQMYLNWKSFILTLPIFLTYRMSLVPNSHKLVVQKILNGRLISKVWVWHLLLLLPFCLKQSIDSNFLTYSPNQTY